MMSESRQDLVPCTPWEELAVQADRGSGGRRFASRHRDRAVLSALRAGSSVRRLSELLGVSVQAIYQASERAEAGETVAMGDRNREILAKLSEFTDPVKFEELASYVLGQFIPDLRPTQRSGDRGRDAVAGDSKLALGEELVVTVSLAEDWSRKISNDMKRLAEQGLRPRRVYAVTSRQTDERRLQRLEGEAQEYGWGLTVFDARWLANQLAQPQNTGLVHDYLGLAAPRPTFFVDAAGFERLLGEASHVPQVPFVGREREAARLVEALGARRTVILEAPGGIGKSRLLSNVGLQDGARRWLFVRAGLPFSLDSLPETGVGEIVVVIDDAHRRGDRHSLLAALERRSPKPLVVLVCRPGFREQIEADLDGLALGGVQHLDLGPLPRPELAQMLEEPPLEVRYGGLRTAIVELSEGNPQIASIAAELSTQGLRIHELRGGEVMRAYAGAVLREAADAGRERISLMALVAAVGTLKLDEDDSEAAGDLLGLPRAHLRRDIADLADRGLLAVEQDGLVSVKPDVLAEHILVGCFFDRDWDPALDYAEVYQAFSPRQRLEMLSILGQAFNAAPDSAERTSPRLDCVRRDLLGEADDVRGNDDAAKALAAVAPGLPDMALEGFDRLLARAGLEGESSAAMWRTLLSIPSRVPIFDEGWRRMLELTRRLFAAHDFADPVVDSAPYGSDEWSRSLKAFNEAFAEVHKRLPLDSPGDGRMLAGVQETMAHLSAAWWCAEGTGAGSPEAALLAARPLLTVFYEAGIADAANPRQINLTAFAVPATKATEHSLAVGFELLSEAMPRLSIKGQLRAVESLRSLASPGLGFSGPFGLEASEGTQRMINGLFEGSVMPWLAEAIGEMPLPVAAAAIELVEWRSHFGGRSSVQVEVRETLRDYRELFEPGEEWGAEERRRARVEREREVADRYARRLAQEGDPRPTLAQWAEWYELRLTATGRRPHGPTLGMLLERVVELDLARGIEVIELLREADSPLLGHAAVAIGAALNRDPSNAEDWLGASSVQARAALARAAGELKDEGLQHRLLEALAQDAQQPVRDAVAVALRYGTVVADWRLDLTLVLCQENRLTWLLEDCLEELVEDGDGVLSEDQLRAIEAAVLATADRLGDSDEESVGDLLEAAQKLGLELVWLWVWRRLERIGAAEAVSGLHEPVPASVMGLVGRELDDAQAARVADRLEETASSEWRLEEILTRLAVLVDDGSLADRLVSWVRNRDSPDDERRIRRVLEAPMSWEKYERYAAAVLAADPSQKHIATVAWAREPTSFVGSRIPKYEAVRDGFAEWESRQDGNLVRVANFASTYFEKRIIEAREEEERWLSHYGP